VKLLSFQLCRGLIAGTICLLVFSGCAPKPRGGVALDEINKTLTEPTSVAVKAKVPPPPAEIRSALIPQPQRDFAAPTRLIEPRFDIAASQVPARDFFMSLVEGSPTSMVVHPEVTGVISVDLKNTTIAEVLEVIYNIYGYPYIKTGNIYQVMSAGMQARTFQVNYLNLVRKGMSKTKVSSGQVTDSASSDDGGGESVSSGSQIETESTADFWVELQAAITGLVGTEDGRRVVIQPMASAVVVVAMPDELKVVGEYLQTIQGNLHRQVIIEAKIIEVSLGDSFQAGINWGALGEPGKEQSILVGQTGGGSVFSNGLSESAGNSGSLLPGGILPNGLDSLAFGGVFSLALNINDFQGFVELLESQGDVQVLSSPRISTLNNQKAVIKVGSDEFFVTDISSDSTTGTTTTTSSDITLTPFFSGIALDVTPQIDATGGITLHIHPAVSEVVDQTKRISAFGVDQDLPLAFSTIRESDSVVYARSGQLIVIGGLMKDKTVQADSGVPVLSDIPWMGKLFQHTKSKSTKSELVILLRPQVINSSAGWDASLGASRNRIDKMAPQFQNEWRKF